ncbi:MAG: hypothetical protein QF460_01605 [Candidatus Nanoarchaeia archaeon]|jgi:hypothetical protein|nr:hypothetical protein [Candidatus Nanoarchaeia archaeon]|tara:strand:+ start:235 stop:918 length:684 start_codon:yes stop_codon:yes gene_type:complete
MSMPLEDDGEVFEYFDAVNNYWAAEKKGDIVGMGEHISRINSSKKNLEAIINKPKKPRGKNRFGWALAISGLLLPLISGTASAYPDYELSEDCVENIETFSESYLDNIEDYDYLDFVREDNLEQFDIILGESRGNVSYTKEEIDFDERHVKYSLMHLADMELPNFGELNSESEIFIDKYIENEIERTVVPIDKCQNKNVYYNSQIVGITATGFCIGVGTLVGTKFLK